jgi:DNA mismatch endonuclease (patch repair protein)
MRTDEPEAPVTVQRSALMSKVRSKNSRPEIRVRRATHALGFRFRLHRRDLPGTPDLVFPKLRSIIFVHGCFWHRHRNCVRCTNPKTRTPFWETKFTQNVARDRRNISALRKMGWRVLVVWECEALNQKRLDYVLENFFSRK